MGNWIIVIEGTGAHHNGKSYDADMIARDAVTTLRLAGQNVERASFVASSRDDLKNGTITHVGTVGDGT